MKAGKTPAFYPASRTLNAPKTPRFHLSSRLVYEENTPTFSDLGGLLRIDSLVGPLVALLNSDAFERPGGFRSMKQRLLLVDDSKIFLDLTSKFLREKGFEVDTSISGELALEQMRKARVSYALVVLDYAMGEQNGANTAREILTEFPEQYIVMCSSDMSRETLQESWKAGAVEFVDKGASPEELLEVIRTWCNKYSENKVAFLPPPPNENAKKITSIGLVGASTAMARAADLVLKYRDQKGNVLVLGESGTGKERVAKALHHNNNHPFRAVNCATYNGEATLMESELFGIEKGSFTGATHDKKGVFEEVGRGTIFLDEVHTLSLRAQQKLLRVLQERMVRPVGSTREYKVHFRLVAAAKPNLEDLVEKGEFLADLYFRLNVLKIEVPSLRERPEDVPILAAYFAGVHAANPDKPKQFLSKTMAYLQGYSWPGNVRELENTVEQLCATVSSDLIQPDDLDAKFFQSSVIRQVNSVNLFRRQVDSMTREMVVKAIQETRSQRAAARKLGIPASTFHDLLKRFGLNGGKRGRKPSIRVGGER